MQYQLSIRKITESDISVQRPFTPEDEDYEMNLSALIEDIQNLEYVTELTQQGGYLVISLESESDFTLLHSAVKSLLSNQYFDKLMAASGFEKVA